MKNYLEKGPAGCDVTLPMDISYRLLENRIETADHALKEGSISAYLRFAHAETLIPNEKEACLPLKSIQTNYYEWNRVKEFFVKYWKRFRIRCKLVIKNDFFLFPTSFLANIAYDCVEFCRMY
ncbi:MAG: hypothetical protein ACLRZ7_09425 [Lachnospiraceae bacterium]